MDERKQTFKLGQCHLYLLKEKKSILVRGVMEVITENRIAARLGANVDEAHKLLLSFKGKTKSLCRFCMSALHVIYFRQKNHIEIKLPFVGA